MKLPTARAILKMADRIFWADQKMRSAMTDITNPHACLARRNGVHPGRMQIEFNLRPFAKFVETWRITIERTSAEWKP